MSHLKRVFGSLALVVFVLAMAPCIGVGESGPQTAPAGDTKNAFFQHH